MSVLLTPYASAAFRNWEICSICLKAMVEFWIFFTGLSPTNRLLTSWLRIWGNENDVRGEDGERTPKHNTPNYTVCFCNDQTKTAKNGTRGGLYSRIHPSARPGSLIFQILASPLQSHTDGWSTPPGSAPAQGRTCCQSCPEPACSGRRTDLCLPCRLPEKGGMEGGGRRSAAKEKQDRLKCIKHLQVCNDQQLKIQLFFLLFMESTALL